ncbi:hypothetical protein [Stenoxybacter acetivorans]|uniref:hypothetical protein n=1 Tax=Stenoxybacter acetivorans TaxID=422441 RepID=UPI0006906FB7|nr:hypothetical protein [Stenoxybacter acetivorans]
MNIKMRVSSVVLLALLVLGLGAVTQTWAKDIEVSANNTPYAKEDVQKLAATAVKMGVKEPLALKLQGGNLSVSGSSSIVCNIKVGQGDVPKISGISCR